MRVSLAAATLFLSTALCVARADERGYADLVRRIAPSVVTILVHEQSESAGQRAVDRATANTDSKQVDDLLRRMLSGPEASPAPERGMSQGSGFIIRSDGLIVTNRHVIAAARTIKVKLQEQLWQQVATVMRDNAATVTQMAKTRAEGAASRTAVDDLESYAEISAAHSEGTKKMIPVFQALYNSMSDAQKKAADAEFREHHRGHAAH